MDTSSGFGRINEQLSGWKPRDGGRGEGALGNIICYRTRLSRIVPAITSVLPSHVTRRIQSNNYLRWSV